jgi:hypothetical protein
MKSIDPKTMRFATQLLTYTLAHFLSGFIGKGHGRYLMGFDTAFLYQVGDFLGNHPGLATAGAGQYQ